MPMNNLSEKQRALLVRMPRHPSDGLPVRSKKLNTANSLVRRQLAVRVGGSPISEAGSYVRIDDPAFPGEPLPRTP